MKKLFAATAVVVVSLQALAQIPKPDHVVVVVLENHAYSQVVGSSNATYLSALSNDTYCAKFTNSFALTHPSQPNYLMLFSGSDQGEITDNVPSNLPFTSCNLGAELLNKGYTFKAYSEDLPSVGFNGATSGKYARKHCPWTNWQNAKLNGIPDSLSRSYSDFPTNYDDLPTLSFVIPNLDDDMHDPAIPFWPANVSNGDDWMKNNLDKYITWCKTHNTLLIITFDEDDNLSSNQIATLFFGQPVKGGAYKESIDHYSVLRTVEDMFGLSHCGNTAASTPITDTWNQVTTGIGSVNAEHPVELSTFPNPATTEINFDFHHQALSGSVSLHNFLGQEVKSNSFVATSTLRMNTSDLSVGVYTYTLKTASGELFTGKVVVQ